VKVLNPLRPAQSAFERFRRATASIAIRLVAFNILLVFLPAAGFLYLDTYEEQLLQAQEVSMVQQGRILAAALSGRGPLDAAEAERVLVELGQRTRARLRVFDTAGQLIADSSRLGPRREPDEAIPGSQPTVRTNWLYRLGAGAFALLNRLLGRDEPEAEISEYGSAPAEPENPVDFGVMEALAGRYGAATRKSPGQRSVTLYSAIPIQSGGEVIGAVQVSQSTLRLLRDLYEVRLAIFQAFLASVLVAVVLSLFVSGTIARPLRRLRREANELLDRRGRLKGRFKGSKRRDEIGDLARALAEQSRRLGDHVSFIESFAADVSHEFKNPLASIRTATEMLAESESPADRQRFRLMVEAEVARLQKLLSAVREITQIDAQIDAEPPTPVAMDRLLVELVEGFRHRVAEEKVRFLVESPGEPLTVLTSPDRLAQACENVLDNALSFAPEGSAVTVSLARERSEAVLCIADQGPGIPPEHLGRVFDRFFSYRPADPFARRDHAGLGLAIVKAIVEGYGGSVSAANSPGRGAVFTVRLPLAV
jgi:two-component system, OmpR family, sensor histidine kinase ChvG